MKYIKMRAITVLAVIIAISACTKDLDTEPLDKDVLTSASVYEDFASYKMVLAKLYAGLAVSGQSGPHGNNDLSGLDEGFGQYLRAYWYAQELATDECIIAWNDGNLKDYHEQDWTSSNEFITNMYYRLFYQIALSNEFIRESSTSKMDERGISQAHQEEVAVYRAEARFLRALSYWHALDLFGNVPFVTEDDKVGSFFPEQIQRADLFDYVESELLAIEDLLPEPGENEYARADQGAVWMLLAKLYLNAEVYTGTDKYTETITYAKKVIIEGGYTLETEWENLFLADNHTADGVIFPVTFDGVNTKTWGGTTFIINAAIGGSMNPADYGVASGGWAGIRVTKEIVGKFYNLETLKKKGDLSARKAFDYPVLYVPGGHQGWNPADTTTVLASVNDDGNYEGYLNFPDANTEFKFTTGPNWDNNYGDTGGDGSLEPGGDNIVAADAGYYKINVDTNAWTYTVTKTDWGLIGDATPGGWDSDTDLTYNAVDGVWELEVDLGTGAIKFRANDGWDINYGDTGVDGILEAGGDNINITEAGTYLIKMKLGFPDYTYTIEKFSSDDRGMFYSSGQSLEITDVFEFTEGWAVTKFQNVTSTGAPGSDPEHPDTDFPMFRLADAYLMYAEAVLRGGTGGDAATALLYVNTLRERAYGDDYGNIEAFDLDLDFILDERAREFLWEAHRRSDLIRFGKFSNTTYTWAWKGGVMEGQSVNSYFDLYPIPASDVAANKNLIQNEGY